MTYLIQNRQTSRITKANERLGSGCPESEVSITEGLVSRLRN
jgi:hypothetical protein